MPLLGFLSLMAGAGMFYTSGQLAERAGEWSVHVEVTGKLTGLILLLWSVRLIAGRFGRAGTKVGRLNRNRVMLPREGMMYLLIMIVSLCASMIGHSNMLMLVFCCGVTGFGEQFRLVPCAERRFRSKLLCRIESSGSRRG